MVYSVSMSTVTISKTKYLKLKRHAEAYRRISSRLFEFAIRDPIEDVVRDFKNTNLYTKEFLKDLEDGLRDSSYSKVK